MPFKNREEAAHLLVQELANYRGENPLILAIPRGAVPMGRIIANELNGEMDVVLVRKLRASFQEELAIGSVDEAGVVYLNAFANQVSKDYIEEEKQRQLAILRQRRSQYTKTHPSPSPEGRIVIVVDDGIATGATMIAALEFLRSKNPKQLIVATPVGSPDSLINLKSHADKIVFLEAPEYFRAVGQFYDSFPQVSDEEVIQILNGIDPPVQIPAGSVLLNGDLVIPPEALGIVIFAHGSGSSRLSPRNQYVASVLQSAQIGTLLFDLLSPEEDENYETRFDIELLTERLLTATQWLHRKSFAKDLALGYFGASTGAAAALNAAATLGPMIRCVVSRGGRPDLAMPSLNKVISPTLLIVGGDDKVVIELNQEAYDQLPVEKQLAIIPGATHLFEEPGTLEEVARLAEQWFSRFLCLQD